MKENVKSIVIHLLVLVILVGMAGCSSKNAECKVTLDQKGGVSIIVNPPGEKGEASQKGTLEKSTKISASGGSVSKDITYQGNIKKLYQESGNTYMVNVSIAIKGERISAYQLSVTGGVYGDAPHTCKFP